MLFKKIWELQMSDRVHGEPDDNGHDELDREMARIYLKNISTCKQAQTD